MKKLIVLSVCLIGLSSLAANITNYPIVTSVGGTEMFLLSSIADRTNKNITYNSLLTQMGASIKGLGVSSFNTRTGDVSLLSADVTTALGYTPAQSSTAAELSQRMRIAANTPLPMGVELYMTVPGYGGQDTVLTWMAYLTNNGLKQVGYDTIRLNLGWAQTNRDVNGNITWNTNFFPNGIPWLISTLRSNGMYLGLYCSASPGYDRDPLVTLATAYNDGYRFGSWGARMLWCDSLYNQTLSDPERRQLAANLVMGLDDGVVASNWTKAVNVDVTDMWDTNRWMADYVNAVYRQPYGDFVTLGPSTWYQAMRYTLTTLQSIVSPQCTRTVQGLLVKNNAAWMDTNYLRAYMGLNCIAPMPLYLNNTLQDYELPIVTNMAAIDINQDPLVTPAQMLVSNSTQIVLARPLMNGDVALGLWNQATNATTTFSFDLTALPWMRTNVVNVLDIFDGDLTSAAWTFMANVQPHGFNFYRLSKGGTYVNTPGIAVAATNSVLTNILAWYRADEVTATNGTQATWTDYAGSFNLDTSTNKPVYLTNVVNGKPSFLFTNNAYLSGAFAGTMSNFTMFVVYKQYPAGDRDESFVFSFNDYLKNPGISERYGQYIHGYAEGANSQVASAATGWIVGGAARSGGTLYTYGPPSQTAINGTLAAIYTFNPTNISIGTITVAAGTNSYYFSGYVPEAICYDTYLSSADTVKVWNYLKSKYQAQ